jgi:hypothetical protein
MKKNSLMRILPGFVSMFMNRKTLEASELSDALLYKPIDLSEKLGSRPHTRHNNRKYTRGRNTQYVHVGKFTKPIYHGAL